MKTYIPRIKLLSLLCLFLTTFSSFTQEKDYYSKGKTTINYEPSAQCDGRPVRFDIEWELSSFMGLPTYKVKSTAHICGNYAYYKGKKYTAPSSDSDILNSIDAQLNDWGVSTVASLGAYQIDIQENCPPTEIGIAGLSSKEILTMIKSGTKLHSFKIDECIKFNMGDFAKALKKEQDITKAKELLVKADALFTNGNYYAAEDLYNEVKAIDYNSEQSAIAKAKLSEISNIRKAEKSKKEAQEKATAKQATNNTAGNSITQPKQNNYGSVHNSSSSNNINKTKSVEYTNKANQFYNNGSYDEAEMYWKKAIELDPNNQAAKNNLTQLKNTQNSNAQIMAQSQQRANNFNTQQANITKSSEQIANKIVDGSPNAIGEAGVATAKLLAESGANFTESMAGGAGVAVVGALLSGGNKVINKNHKIELKEGTFYGESIDNWPKEGRFEFNNGSIFEGRFLYYKGPSAGYRKKYTAKPWLHKGTLLYNDGKVFKGTFNQISPNLKYYPGNGTLTYADGSTFNGQFYMAHKNRGKYKYGNYTSADGRVQINGSFSDDRLFSLGTITYAFPDKYTIKWTYTQGEELGQPTIVFNNTNLLIFTTNKNQSHPKIVYHYKLNNKSKKTTLNPSKPQELIKTIIDADEEKNLSNITAIIANQTEDEQLKSTYFDIAIKYVTSEKGKAQVLELKNHPIIARNVATRWIRHAYLCQFSKYLEYLKNDAWYNALRAVECYGENRSELAKSYVEKTISKLKNDGDDKLIEKYYSNIGTHLSYINKQYDEGIKYLLKALPLNDSSDHQALAYSYYHAGNYLKSIEHGKLAIESASKKRKKEIKNVAVCYYHIALSYLNINRFEKAKTAFIKARKINKKENLNDVINILEKIKSKGSLKDEVDYIITEILQ
ncbi:MAG: hypothetical protein N4A59_05550 [Marinifilum sp.]|jgi:tetratricopeptide (TPR) repeat protein|nr:hypothetical protein [Marinifilum sp.]